MSLITQCPACATMFRVVPDQLRISEGWVRCGQCDEVFDANAHLQSWSPSAAPALNASALSEPSEPQAMVRQASPLADVQGVPEAAPYDWSGMDTGQPVQGPAATAAPQPDHEPEPEPESTPEPPVELAAEEAFVAFVPSAEPHEATESDSFLSRNPHALPGAQVSLAAQEAVASVAHQHTLPQDHTALDTRPNPIRRRRRRALPQDHTVPDTPLSFMPRKVRRQPWLRPALLVFVGLAAAVLVLQFALFERNRLAAIFPGAAPVLEAACAAVGCSIAAPRQIDAFAIESSTFNAVKPGVYVLQVTLKNSATLDLESPALELSLSDRQEQVVLRRTLQAAEYTDGTPVIAAGSERSFRIPLAIGDGVSSRQIAGYKLLAYYP